MKEGRKDGRTEELGIVITTHVDVITTYIITITTHFIIITTHRRRHRHLRHHFHLPSRCHRHTQHTARRFA